MLWEVFNLFKAQARIPPGLIKVLSLVVAVRSWGRGSLDRKSIKKTIENYTEMNDNIDPKRVQNHPKSIEKDKNQ